MLAAGSGYVENYPAEHHRLTVAYGHRSVGIITRVSPEDGNIYGYRCENRKPYPLHCFQIIDLFHGFISNEKTQRNCEIVGNVRHGVTIWKTLSCHETLSSRERCNRITA
jgi:hypothetical protein